MTKNELRKMSEYFGKNLPIHMPTGIELPDIIVQPKEEEVELSVPPSTSLSLNKLDDLILVLAMAAASLRKSLLPCAFCGSGCVRVKKVEYSDYDPDYYIICDDCQTSGRLYKAELEARAAWNNRIKK